MLAQRKSDIVFEKSDTLILELHDSVKMINLLYLP